MITKYFNDAIVGNRTVTASFSKTGELLSTRFFLSIAVYPQPMAAPAIFSRQDRHVGNINKKKRLQLCKMQNFSKSYIL